MSRAPGPVPARAVVLALYFVFGVGRRRSEGTPAITFGTRLLDLELIRTRARSAGRPAPLARFSVPRSPADGRRHLPPPSSARVRTPAGTRVRTAASILETYRQLWEGA